MGFLIYLVGMCDNLGTAFSFIAFGSVIWACGLFSIASDEIESKAAQLSKRGRKIILFCTVPLILLRVLIPDSRQMAAIILIPRIVNSETVQDLGSKGTSLLELKLDAWIKEMTEDKK